MTSTMSICCAEQSPCNARTRSPTAHVPAPSATPSTIGDVGLLAGGLYRLPDLDLGLLGWLLQALALGNLDAGAAAHAARGEGRQRAAARTRAWTGASAGARRQGGGDRGWRTHARQRIRPMRCRPPAATIRWCAGTASIMARSPAPGRYPWTARWSTSSASRAQAPPEAHGSGLDAADCATLVERMGATEHDVCIEVLRQLGAEAQRPTCRGCRPAPERRRWSAPGRRAARGADHDPRRRWRRPGRRPLAMVFTSVP